MRRKWDDDIKMDLRKIVYTNGSGWKWHRILSDGVLCY
jgi:hypothetical protein